MPASLRYVAPSGAPIRLVDLGRWVASSASRGDSAETLRQLIRGRFGVRHVVLTRTGRAGLTLLLRALRRITPAGRDEVVLPAYTCFSVAASVVKAGLKVRVVDVSPRTLDYSVESLERAEFGRVLAMVATNLYGLPNDLPKLSAVARDRGVFLIDDAAQAMGAMVGGRWSGTWGDAGLFSLDKGKNVSAIDGGIVVTNSDAVAEALRHEATSLPGPGAFDSLVGVVKALGYFAMLRPWLYGIPNAIPQLELGRTVFTTDFPLHGPSRPLLALATIMLERLDEFTRARRQNAQALLAAVTADGTLRPVEPTPAALPVYLRLPLLAPDAAVRDTLLGRLNAARIGATGSYPGSIADIPELRDCMVTTAGAGTAGRQVAERMLTLPTHQFVGRSDLARAIAAIQRRDCVHALAQ